MLKSDTRGLRRRETSRRKVYRCSVKGERGRRASRLCSWIVKIADLYVVFIAAHSRSLRAWNPSSSGDNGGGLFPGTFSKSRAHGPSLETSASSVVGATRGPETHGAQTIALEKDFYPTGGPRGFSSVCAHPVPRNPAKPGFSDYIFPSTEGKIRGSPYGKKTSWIFDKRLRLQAYFPCIFGKPFTL